MIWIADAVRFVREPAAEPEIVIDDSTAAKTGTWLNGTWTGGGQYWQTNFVYHAAGSATITWTPTLPEARSYKVYAWWSAGATGRRRSTTRSTTTRARRRWR